MPIFLAAMSIVMRAIILYDGLYYMARLRQGFFLKRNDNLKGRLFMVIMARWVCAVIIQREIVLVVLVAQYWRRGDHRRWLWLNSIVNVEELQASIT